MLVDGLYTLLSGFQPLADIVGNRIYALILPKNYTVPAVTFYQVSNKTEVAMDRTIVSTDPIEFNVWATNYRDAAAGQQALHALLDLYQGTLSDGTRVLYTSGADNSDFYEKDSKLYRCSTTFTFTH